MVTQDILEPVVGPTDWASPIVLVTKPGRKVRICMDPRALNEYVIREKCWIPTPETVFAQLGKARYFTVLDASNAFHQIQLDDDSSKLCTITTPYGRFRYKRLPYGLSSAPEVFQKAIGDILEGIPGTINYIDDILIYGSTLEEHDERLENVLKRIQKAGLKLSRDKMQLAVDKIRYLGHVISHEGIEVDRKKLEAITSIPEPKTKKDLQRFLGLVTYLAKYIPNLAEKSAPLRQLLSQKNAWTWEKEGPEEKAFEGLKTIITTSPVLRHYDTQKEVTLSVDASNYGLGAILMQNSLPVAYASATLTQTQRRYSQIEKELLAVVYACEHFNYFVFGRIITVQTDHKPLLSIVKKPIDSLTPRLQRLVLRLMRYNINLMYVPGKNLIAADALSRDPNKHPINTEYLDEIRIVCPVQITTSKRTQELKKATKEDTEFGQIVHYCMTGWPSKQKHLPQLLRKYWSSRHSYHYNEDLLYKGTALMIPLAMRSELLKIIHNTHQGIESCRARARNVIYWPGIMGDIKELINKCRICQQYSKSNTKETLKPHEVPKLPWEKLGIDFKTHGNLNYLVIIDYYSKFTVVYKVIDKTATSVMLALKNLFALMGLPKVLFSDNGPPFDSGKYNTFLGNYDIIKNTSSPHYPQSNGMVERSVQNVKAMIHKVVQENEDLMLAVLNHNMTPKQGTLSPAEILMGRRLRTLVPTSDDLLKPFHDTTEHYEQLLGNSNKMVATGRSNQLSTLIPGQPIYVQKATRQWEPAQIQQNLGNNSYNIITDQGTTIRRNRYHLKPRYDDRPLEWNMEDEILQENLSQRHCPEQNTMDQDCREEKVDIPVMNECDKSNGKMLPKTLEPNIIITKSGRVVKPPKKLDL